MRPIDADVLKEDIACHKVWTDQEYETDRQWAVGFNAGIERALFNITYAKTVDAEPVRHGRWESECEPNYKCSCCEHYFHLYQPMNYCPNCGVKMDAEVEG